VESARSRSLVSVALTTFNVAPFLDEALAGVTAQTHRPLELVAYDDASADDSVVRLEHFRRSAGFPVTILGGSTNLGAMRALKRAIAGCSGKYVAILDGDDVWLPGKLAAQVEWLEANPRRVLCGHDVECFESGTGEVVWTARGRRLLCTGSGAARSVRNGPLFPTSAVMLRRDAIPSDFNPFEMRAYHDWSLWSDCLANGGIYGYVPGVYSRYRRNPDGDVARQASSMQASTQILEDGLIWLGAFEANHPEYHAACRFRRATLLANHGRLLFEQGHREAARTYVRAALPSYGPDLWKGVGLMVIASLPPRLASRVYSLVNPARTAMRRLVGIR
jgi:glycosyltransferase involved in cell wall biosynthesis